MSHVFPSRGEDARPGVSSKWRRESQVLFLRGIFLLNLFMTESVCTPVHSISDRGTVSKFPGAKRQCCWPFKKDTNGRVNECQ